MRFAANISTLLRDVPLISKRFQLIASRDDFIFDAVEAQNPYQCSIQEWKQLKTECPSLKWVLINSPPLWETGDRIPSQQEFNSILEKTAEYVKELNVPKVHLVMQDINTTQEIPQIIDLLSIGARFFQPLGVLCVIEPLAIRNNYYLRSYSLAKDIVEKINEPNLKILLDSFHLQKLHGNLTHYIELLSPHIGHVQVSQVPLRDSPIADGEINHHYFLKKVNAYYKDYIGLEYQNESGDSFAWLNNYKEL